MKVVSLIFEQISNDLSQVYWAIDNLLQPFMHHVVLIFVLPDVMYTFNDPYNMLSLNKTRYIHKKEREKETKDFLISIDKLIRKYCDESIEISKLVITGNEYQKLYACILSLNIKSVILGHDTEFSGLCKLFFQTYDQFLLKKLDVTVIRVPKNSRKINKRT